MQWIGDFLQMFVDFLQTHRIELTAYLIAAFVFLILYLLTKAKLNFSIRVLAALFIGVIVGLLFRSGAHHLRVFGVIYINFIKALVVPLVTVAIIHSFTQLEDLKTLRSIGTKSIFWLLSTTAIGAVLGLLAGKITKLGTNLPLPARDNPYNPDKFVDAIVKLLPSNYFNDAVSNNVLAIIIFSIIIAIAVMIERQRNPERVKPFKDFIDSAYHVMVRVTKIVIRLTPYGIFGYVASAIARNNIETFKTLGIYLLVIYGVMLIHFIVVQLGLVTFVARLNPFQWLKKVYPAQVVGFTSQSSYGTLPVTISSLNNAGVSPKVSNFVAPLGANVGMNACSGIYPAIVAMITAHAYGIELQFSHYVIIVIASVIASIGIAGMPGFATFAATIVLSTLPNFPLEGLMIVWSVEALVDMGRTAVNITGAMVAATIVARSENEFDMEQFYSVQDFIEET